MVREVYKSYEAFLHQTTYLELIGFEAFHIGMVTFFFVIIRKGRLIVDFIIEHLDLLNKVQYRKSVIYCSSILIMSLIKSVLGFCIFSDDLVEALNKTKPFDAEFVSQSYKSLIGEFYDSWVSTSSFIYGLMYYEMHLKHRKLVQNLIETKSCSYSIIYKALTQVRSDHCYFDHLVSLFPFVWLLFLFIGCGAMMEVILSYDLEFRDIRIVTIIHNDIICWSIVLIFIVKCHSEFSKDIEVLKYQIATNDKIDEHKGLTVLLLEQMENVHTTAGSLIKLNKGLLLPLCGTIVSFYFLFKDNFFESIKDE